MVGGGAGTKCFDRGPNPIRKMQFRNQKPLMLQQRFSDFDSGIPACQNPDAVAIKGPLRHLKKKPEEYKYGWRCCKPAASMACKLLLIGRMSFDSVLRHARHVAVSAGTRFCDSNVWAKVSRTLPPCIAGCRSFCFPRVVCAAMLIWKAPSKSTAHFWQSFGSLTTMIPSQTRSTCWKRN